MPDLFVPQDTPQAAPTVLQQAAAVPASSSNETRQQNMMPLFATLCRKPLGITFQNQDPDESIVLFLRRHLVTNIPWLFIAAILILLPITFPFLAESLLSPLPAIPTQYMIIGTTLYYLLVIGFMIYQLMNWFYNISIVTNKKVIDVDYTRITAKDVSTATLDAVEDVTYKQNGFIRTQFNFGTVEVLTQSINKEILFEDVPRPADITATIIDLKQGITEP